MSKDQVLTVGGMDATAYMGEHLDFPPPPPTDLIDGVNTADPYEVLVSRTHEALNDLDAYVDGRNTKGMQPVYDAIELLQDQLGYIHTLVDRIANID